MTTLKQTLTITAAVLGLMIFGWVAEASTHTGVVGLIAVFTFIFSILALVLFMATEEQ
jgi:hypothetical protein